MSRHRSPHTTSSGRRLGIITVDQAIAGSSNVLASVLAAHFLPTAQFGYFGIIFLLYVLLQSAWRALVCDPLLVHSEEAERRVGDVIGTCAVLSLGLSAGTAIAGLCILPWRADFGGGIVVLAIALPLLAMQDLGRYLAIGFQRPVDALKLDLAWLILMVAAIPVLAATSAHSLPSLVVAWAGAGAVSGLLLFVQHRDRVRIGVAWLRFTWSFSWRYLISYTSTQGVALAGSAAVGAILGARALGAVQGSILLIRPFATLQIALIAAGVSDIARHDGGVRFAVRRGRQISGVAAVVAALNGLVILVVPDRLGRLVLGDTWAATKPLLLATAVQLLFLAAIAGARAGLLGSRAPQRTVRIDVAGTVAVLIGLTAASATGSVVTVLWVLTAVQGGLAAIWWQQFHAEARVRIASEALASATHEREDVHGDAAVPGSPSGRRLVGP